MAEYTKGPWSYVETGDGALVRMGEDTNMISGKNVIYMGDDFASARLIAAAPDMLEALENITSILESIHEDNEVLNAYKAHYDLEDIKAARNTIAKAKGESK